MGKASAEVSPKASKKEREAAETKPGVGIPIKALAVGEFAITGRLQVMVTGDVLRVRIIQKRFQRDILKGPEPIY